MDRIATARARVDVVKAVALKAKAAGPPCSDCHFRTLLGNCGNPAYASPSFDPAAGVYSERFEIPVTAARSDDGLCGPEALLFEPNKRPIIVAKAVFGIARTIGLSFTFVLLVITFASMLLR